MSPPDCAIVIPVHRPELSPYEIISLQQCGRLFGRYPLILTGPEKLALRAYRELLPGALWEPLPPEHFKSVNTYSRLLMNAAFYERFARYRHILIHQSDAFVFRDDLPRWCGSDYDYVGAPFPYPRVRNHKIEEWKGRNGGLSLRRTSAFLDILTARRATRLKSLRQIVSRYLEEHDHITFKQLKRFYRKQRDYPETLGELIDLYTRHEDVFWSVEVPRTNVFRIPAPLESARFALETEPRSWIDRLAGEIPAGCHAWWTYDLELWKPHIEQCGYQLPAGTDARLSRRAA